MKFCVEVFCWVMLVVMWLIMLLLFSIVCVIVFVFLNVLLSVFMSVGWCVKVLYGCRLANVVAMVLCVNVCVCIILMSFFFMMSVNEMCDILFWCVVFCWMMLMFFVDGVVSLRTGVSKCVSERVVFLMFNIGVVCGDLINICCVNWMVDIICLSLNVLSFLNCVKVCIYSFCALIVASVFVNIWWCLLLRVCELCCL